MNIMNDEEYTRKLENVIKQYFRPLRELPDNLLSEILLGYKIIPFDSNDSRDDRVLKTLLEVADVAGRTINEVGILRPRPNEVGNDIEIYVKNALNDKGYVANTPKTKSGKGKTTGYPDIEFIDEFGRVNYLECKTFNLANISTTQRSFYLSPSEDFKVMANAHHFVLSFEVYIDGRLESNNVYKCKSWKILSIENLDVDVKYEFNSDNARPYAKEMILAEGNL